MMKTFIRFRSPSRSLISYCEWNKVLVTSKPTTLWLNMAKLTCTFHCSKATAELGFRWGSVIHTLGFVHIFPGMLYFPWFPNSPLWVCSLSTCLLLTFPLSCFSIVLAINLIILLDLLRHRLVVRIRSKSNWLSNFSIFQFCNFPIHQTAPRTT